MIKLLLFCSFLFLTVEDELPVHDGKHTKFSFVEFHLNLIKIFFSFLQFQWLIEREIDREKSRQHLFV